MAHSGFTNLDAKEQFVFIQWVVELEKRLQIVVQMRIDSGYRFQDGDARKRRFRIVTHQLLRPEKKGKRT